jgi:Ca-activated chloride channel family protein
MRASWLEAPLPTVWIHLLAAALLALALCAAGCTKSRKGEQAPAPAPVLAEDKKDWGRGKSVAEAPAASTVPGTLAPGAAYAETPAPRPPTRTGLGPPVGGGANTLGGEEANKPGYGPHARRPPGPVEAPLDPNGRFATTYRPGGGHLAAFESAVARGIVPPAEREVVSDVGARYAPVVQVAAGKALGFRADLERTRLPPAGGPLHVRLALQSTGAKPGARPHLSVHLVLDVSGSMQGESIVRAKDAAHGLVNKLAATDDFSLVTFSTDAAVKVADGPAGARRAEIHKAIDEVQATGGTNIGEGLRLGYAQARSKAIPADAVRVVMLLSDGRANGGVTDPVRLARFALDAFQDGIQTSTFGLGADYDGALMSAIASDGAGGYYYLRDAEQIAPALATELEKRVDPVATAVEVRVRLKKDVELTRVYGSRRLTESEAARVRAVEVAADQQAEKRDKIKKDREDDPQGGMRFFIPAFARDDSHAMLLGLRVPKGAGKRDVAFVELKYKDRIGKKNVTEEMSVSVAFADSDADSAASADASVARTVQGFAAGETLMEAAVRLSRGDRTGASAILGEREQILRQAAQTLGEPGLVRDAERLARLRAHTGQPTGVGDPLVLAMLLETAGRSHLR